MRQLRNVIDSAVVLAEDPEIKSSDLGLHEPAGGELESLKLKDWEQRLITEACCTRQRARSRQHAGDRRPDAIL